MQYDEKLMLSKVRIEHAEQCLADAKLLLQSESYKGAANRSYFTVFHSMRAVLALDGIDKRKHSGIISEFRRLYIKTGIFDPKLSESISSLFSDRTNGDYDDFYFISKEKTVKQVEKAQYFLETVKQYLENL